MNPGENSPQREGKRVETGLGSRSQQMLTLFPLPQRRRPSTSAPLPKPPRPRTSRSPQSAQIRTRSPPRQPGRVMGQSPRGTTVPPPPSFALKNDLTPLLLNRAAKNTRQLFTSTKNSPPPHPPHPRAPFSAKPSPNSTSAAHPKPRPRSRRRSSRTQRMRTCWRTQWC